MPRSWVYILECRDGSYYTGCTTNLEQRIAQHQSGHHDGYTALRLPVKVKWTEEFADVRYAEEVEQQIKGWSRAKKEALFEGDFDLLHELAMSTTTKNRLKVSKNIE